MPKAKVIKPVEEQNEPLQEAPKEQTATVRVQYDTPLSNLPGVTHKIEFETEPDEPEEEEMEWEEEEDEDEPESPNDATRKFLARYKESEVYKAYVYNVPETIAATGLLPQKLPQQNTPGAWPFCGVIPFSPYQFEEDVYNSFPDGTYWLEVRRNGIFEGKFLIKVANTPTSRMQQQADAQPAAILPPQPPPAPAPLIDPMAVFEPGLQLAERITKLHQGQPPLPVTPPTDPFDMVEKVLTLRDKLSPPAPAPAVENPTEKEIMARVVNAGLESLFDGGGPTERPGIMENVITAVAPKLGSIAEKTLDAINAYLQASAPAAAPPRPKPATKSNPAPKQPAPTPAQSLPEAQKRDAASKVAPGTVTEEDHVMFAKPKKLLEQLANGIKNEEEIERHAQTVYAMIDTSFSGQFIYNLVDTETEILLGNIRELLPEYKAIADLPHAGDWLGAVQDRVAELANEAAETIDEGGD